MKSKLKGFTIVELIVVVVILAILVSLGSLAYRETQKNARNEMRKSDSAILIGAIEEYRSDKGDYPKPSSCSTECQSNEAWQLLKDEGYLRDILSPGERVSIANYHYRYGSSSSYAVRIPLEPSGTSCKSGKNMSSSWFESAANCDF